MLNVIHRRRYNETSVAAETPAIMEQVASASEAVDDAVMEADPDEPRYCICNEVAFGDMVACDNKKVRVFLIVSYRIYALDYFDAIFLVSLRMVPLSMRWHHKFTKRKMVLSSMHCKNETKTSKIYVNYGKNF